MKPSAARERILKTASALFYKHGINNVGIDTVVAQSDVAKMTLYHHFKSKDDLVEAFLANTREEWLAWLKARVESLEKSPRKRPLAVFDALGEWFASPSFRGCPFINTAVEVADRNHPAAHAAKDFKRTVQDYLTTLVRESGQPRFEEVADALALLADGAIVRAAMTGNASAAVSAKRAAKALIA